MNLLLMVMALATSDHARTAQTTLPPRIAALLGAAQEVRTDGPVVQFRTNEGVPLRLQPVRYEPVPARSGAVNGKRCGVLISSEGRLIALATIGRGDTEALSCDGFMNAGLVRASSLGMRIAIIYKTRSPNETSRMPIVIVQDRATKRWSIDEALSSRLADQLGSPTIGAIRRALAKH